MTKTYELPNNKRLMADVDEKHHTATVSVYVLDDLVESVNKTGYWILKIEDWNKWICSNCGFSERTDIHVTLGYKYCPSCGARMIESQESENT